MADFEKDLAEQDERIAATFGRMRAQIEKAIADGLPAETVSAMMSCYAMTRISDSTCRAIMIARFGSAGAAGGSREDGRG